MADTRPLPKLQGTSSPFLSTPRVQQAHCSLLESRTAAQQAQHCSRLESNTRVAFFNFADTADHSTGQSQCDKPVDATSGSRQQLLSGSKLRRALSALTNLCASVDSEHDGDFSCTSEHRVSDPAGPSRSSSPVVLLGQFSELSS